MSDKTDVGAVQQVGQVDRGLELPGDAPEGRTRTSASISREFPTDVDDLWQACTVPDRLARWFAPVTLEGEAAEGGRYQVEGNAGGVVLSCDPPRSYRLTWEFGGETSEVEVRIDPVVDGRSRLTLTHSGDVANDFWEQYGPGATGIGWDLAFLALWRNLSSREAAPGTSEDWAAGDEARAFMRACGAAWAEAEVAAGVPEGTAAARRDRTIAFYVGE